MWKELLPTVKDTSVVVIDVDDDADLRLHMLEGRRPSQKTADFEAGLKNAGAGPKVGDADPDGRRNSDAPGLRDLGLVGEDG